MSGEGSVARSQTQPWLWPPPQQDPINRQNAAFACGIIAHTAPQQAAPHTQQLLQALHALFRPDEEAGARDNAAGAVGRMLLSMGGALPIEQIVPVLVGALPLQVGWGWLGVWGLEAGGTLFLQADSIGPQGPAATLLPVLLNRH
jgi:hypothetical protein